jgi:hypothetical protein
MPVKRWRRDVARRHASRDWIGTSVTGVRPLLRILPIVEGTVPPANVIAVAIAMESASDAAAHAGSPELVAYVSSAEVAAHVSTAKAPNTAPAKAASMASAAKSATVTTTAAPAAATCLRIACK